MSLDLTFPVDRVRGATYNPREIAPDALERLQHSIASVGFCKPIIVLKDGLTIAGHQRTKAARGLGLTTVPAWVIADDAVMSEEDEILFNQLHNGTDLHDINVPVRITARGHVELDAEGREGAFELVPPEAVEGDASKAEGAPLRVSLAGLILKYGAWGCVVTDEEGSVLDGPHYALVCRQLGVPVRVYRVASDAVETAQRAFEQQYGAYSYRHIDKKPYIQSFAQPKRDGSSTPVFSRLYKERIVPVAKAGKRVLDFGCGGGAPVRRLQAMGCRVQGIEFFPRRPGTEALDTVLSRAMIGSALRDLQVNGRFDAVICDFVVNSVQTPEAEEDVMTLVNAFCRPGGLICASGRRMANEDKVHKTTKQADADHRRRHHFFDEHGFTAKLGRGQWFFQRFHTDDEANAYPARYGYDGEADVRLDGEQWFSAGYKTRDLDEARVIEALAREFDLEWPNGQRVGRAETALAAWAAAMGREKH